MLKQEAQPSDTDAPKATVLLLIRLSQIEPYPAQPRQYFDPDEIAELADDIQQNGQQHPVRVCKHPKKEGKYLLIGGERRSKAFAIIAERTKTDPEVKALLETIVSERELFREALRDNLRQANLVPLDEAATYTRLYGESTAGSHTAKLAEIALDAGCSANHVENYLLVDSLPKEVKLLMHPKRRREEKLSITSAIDIAKGTSNNTLRFTLAKEIVDGQLGAAEARGLIAAKTGKTGYGIAGRLRKPSDEYKMLKSFLGRTSKGLQTWRPEEIDALYANREDDFGDRERDARLIRDILRDLESLLKVIELPK